MRICLCCLLLGLTTFSLSAAGNTLQLINGQGQLDREQFPASEPLVVQVNDANGRPVAGATVSFAITNGPGQLLTAEFTSTPTCINTASCITDATGQARVRFLASTIYPYSFLPTSIIATSGSSSVSFTETTFLSSQPGGGGLPEPFVNELAPGFNGNRTITGNIGDTIPGAVQLTVAALSGPSLGAAIPNVAVQVSTGLDPSQGPTAACNGPAGVVLTDSRGLATCDIILGGQPGTVPLTITVGGTYNRLPVTLVANAAPTGPGPGPGPSTGSLFVPVTPCRVSDTRNGSTPLAAGETRNFTIPSSNCGIPASATAYSLNITAVPSGPLAYLSAWPTGQSQPLVSTLNALSGNVVANAAIVPAGTNGAISVFATNRTDVVIDVNGYFDKTDVNGLDFYPLTPCRLSDTRNVNGPLGGPIMNAGETRSVSIPVGLCGIGQATAYSLNVTVVPQEPLGYLSLWPAGQAQPLVSTLNSLEGKVTANAAIVRTGNTGGFGGSGISVFVTNRTDVVFDIDGYFGPATAGGLRFYPVQPCRVADTRTALGALAAGESRTFSVTGSSCGIPAVARAYSLNVTAVPSGPLGYLTVWPTGVAQPFVSTLNSDGRVIANAAIVPAGTSGSVNVYVTNPSNVVLDINGYFAP